MAARQNFGDDKQGAHQQASENRASGQDSKVEVQHHDTGTGKMETDYVVVTEDAEDTEE